VSHESTVLSVVIPVFNSAGWITKCLEHLAVAFRNAGVLEPDVIVVDDGSTDGSGDEAAAFQLFPVRVIKQQNLGRFKARQNGLSVCSGSHVLFIDSRVFMGADSLSYVIPQLSEPKTSVWTADVQAQTAGNELARFWRAIETVFWRRYMVNPTTTSFGLDEFDYFPKGTTALILPCDLAAEAMHDFVPTVSDWRKVNDDTALLRYVAAMIPINISPDYTCTYNARTTVRSFLKHANHRGSVLIDGYLRRGTRLNVPIWIVLTMAPLVALPIILAPTHSAALLVMLPLLIGFTARYFGARTGDSAVLTVMFWPFFVSYLTGMYWGLWLKIRGTQH
jgi:hypothetical protein